MDFVTDLTGFSVNATASLFTRGNGATGGLVGCVLEERFAAGSTVTPEPSCFATTASSSPESP